MANYPGILVAANLTNSTLAFTGARFRLAGDFDSIQALRVPSPIRGSYAAGTGGHSIPAGTASLPGRVATEYTSGYDWFDRMHLIPRKVFAFGTILSQVTDTFEIFNANRVAVTLTSLVNPLASVTIPELPSIPASLAPFTSFVDPDSAGRLAYTNVGFAVSFTALQFVVAKNGPPVMDHDLEFVFGTGQTLTMHLTGTRVSVILPVYEETFEEHWVFPSDTIESDDGHEQVLSITKNPIQVLNLTYLLSDTDRQRMHNLLLSAAPQILAMPILHEAATSSAAASIAATSISVLSTTDRDFRVGQYAMIWESSTKYDIVLVSSVTTTSIGFATTPLIYAYSSRARVTPIRLGYLTGQVRGNRYQPSLETFQVQFTVLDNDTGAPTGSTSGWNTYNSKVLLDDPNLMTQDTAEHGFLQRIHLIDNATGVIQQSSDMLRAMRRATKGFMMRNLADIAKVKRLLRSLRGPQVSWRIPTFAEDLTVAANITSGATTLDITHVGYTKFVNCVEPKKHFRITFTDGTSLDREIMSTTEVSDTVERLTLNTTWPANRNVSEVVRVSFLELTRFNTDRFVFRYERYGLARLVATTKTLLE